MGPIDYNIQVADPLQGLAQGLQLGAGLRQIQQQRALQEQYKTDLQAYNANPTAQGAAQLGLKYPGQAENIRKSWELMDSGQRNDQQKVMGESYAALLGGRPDITRKRIEGRIQALEASKQDATAERDFLRILDQDPNKAKASLGFILSSVDPKNFASQFAALSKNDREAAQFPLDQQKTQAEIQSTQAGTQKTLAEAGIKAVEAGNAPTRVALENATAEQGILNSEANRRIQELNVQIAKANSETQRGQLILERDKLIADQGQKATARANDAQGQMDTIQNTLATVDRVLKHPGLDGFFFGAGTLGGKQAALFPGTDSKDFRALLDQLTSQQFLSNVKQLSGMGALSNAEGEKIAAAAGNLSADQSPSQLRTTLGVITSNLNRARERVIGSGNLSTTDKTFVFKSPTYGNVTEGQINKLLLQYPGATREQVMQFLGARR